LSDQQYSVTFLLPDGSQPVIHCSADEPILVTAYREGLDELPSTCLQGWCLTCAGRVENGGEWDQSLSRRYFPQDHEAGFILPCTARPRSDLVIRTHQREAMVENRIRQRLPAPRGKW
jgi:ferredoxin